MWSSGLLLQPDKLSLCFAATLANQKDLQRNSAPGRLEAVSHCLRGQARLRRHFKWLLQIPIGLGMLQRGLRTSIPWRNTFFSFKNNSVFARSTCYPLNVFLKTQSFCLSLVQNGDGEKGNLLKIVWVCAVGDVLAHLGVTVTAEALNCQFLLSKLPIPSLEDDLPPTALYFLGVWSTQTKLFTKGKASGQPRLSLMYSLSLSH